MMPNKMIETLTQYHPQAYRVTENAPMNGSETITIPSTGVVTPIIRFRVPRKANWLVNAFPMLLMKLRDASNNELPRTAKIFIGFKHSVQAVPTWKTEGDSYAPWLNVSFANQYDKNFQARLHLSLGSNIALDEDAEIWFGVSQNSGSSFTLDWSKCDFLFDIYQILV